VTTNPANNQLDGIPGTSFDANGNFLSSNNVVGYDAENRVSSVYTGSAVDLQYGYDAQNRRTFLWPGANDSTGYNPNVYSVVMYSPTGQKLGTYQINTYYNSSTSLMAICATLMSSDQYFGARRLAVLDQLGSAGTYFGCNVDPDLRKK
jgi:hypothetical protein